MQSEIAALRFLRDQMDNDISEGYVTVAMRDPAPPAGPRGSSRRRRGGHEPPAPADADPGPPIIAHLAVTPDQIVHIAIPDFDGGRMADVRPLPPPTLSRANSAASIGSAGTHNLSRRWPSLSSPLDEGGRGGESGGWRRGSLWNLRGSAAGSVFDADAESRVLVPSAALADLPPGVDWVVASLDVSLCPWWREMFGGKGRGGDTSGTLWRRVTLGGGFGSLSRGLREAATTASMSFRSASQPITPGAAAVNNWFADTADVRGMRSSRPGSAAVSRVASFDSDTSGAGSVLSLPRPWSGEAGVARPPRPAAADGGDVMWPGPVGVAAVSGEWAGSLVRGPSVGVRLTPRESADDAPSAAEAGQGPGEELVTVSSSGLPMPPTAALEESSRLGVYTPPQDLEPSAAVPRGGQLFGGFGPLVRTCSSGGGSLSRSRQHSVHAFHALESMIAEEADERSGSQMTM